MVPPIHLGALSMALMLWLPFELLLMCIHIHSLLPLPLLLPIHPLQPVTSSHTPHLSRRFTSWSLTPPPRSDSVRSTVHNVRTPCRPLRTQQGGRVRCHTHTIRRPPRPYTVVRTHWHYIHILCVCCYLIYYEYVIMDMFFDDELPPFISYCWC